MVEIGDLIEKYGSIKRIPEDAAREAGFFKIVSGNSFQLVRADKVPEILPPPYPIFQRANDLKVIDDFRQVSVVPLPAISIPAYGKELPEDQTTIIRETKLFRNHWLLEENKDFWRGGHVLDIGCWYDLFAFSLTQLLGNDFQYTGVEINKIAYEHPEKTRGKTNILFHEETNYRNYARGVAHKSVDILCIFGLGVPDTDYRTLQQLLKDDGYFFLDNPLVHDVDAQPFARRSFAIEGMKLREQIYVRAEEKFGIERKLDPFEDCIFIYSKA